jgi:hypothetical protein
MENLRIPNVKVDCAKKILSNFEVKLIVPTFNMSQIPNQFSGGNMTYVITYLNSIYYSGANIYTFNFIVSTDLVRDSFFFLINDLKKRLEILLEKIQITNIVVTLRVGDPHELNRYY